MNQYAEEAGCIVGWYVDKGSGDALPALKALLTGAGSPDRDFDTGGRVLLLQAEPVRQGIAKGYVRVAGVGCDCGLAHGVRS